MAYAPEQGALTALNTNASPSWHPWQVSLRQQITLGERFDYEEEPLGPGELVAISLIGQGEQLLASNVYPYHVFQIAMDLFHPFTLTDDGRHAVYISAEPGTELGSMQLSAVPTDSGAPVLLSSACSGYDYDLSPADPDKIAFFEWTGEQPDLSHELRLGEHRGEPGHLSYRGRGSQLTAAQHRTQVRT